MTDPRYTYEKINAIKIILENKDGKILLVKEPHTNEWMPGHWGLPGGKTLKKESLYNAFKRKSKVDLGLELEPAGIYRIEELLKDGYTVLIFHAVAKIKDNIEIKGEIEGFMWVGVEEVKKMDLMEFTEFYNKSFILEYLSGNKEIIDFNLIETQNYYDLENDPEYKKWFESGKKLVPNA